jgi:hypothetical protein
MWKWLRSKFGIGPEAISLPEAETHGVFSLFLGQSSTLSEPRWEYHRPSIVLASYKRVGNRVIELKVKRSLIDTPVIDEILQSLRDYQLPTPTVVDQV